MHVKIFTICQLHIRSLVCIAQLSTRTNHTSGDRTTLISKALSDLSRPNRPTLSLPPWHDMWPCGNAIANITADSRRACGNVVIWGICSVLPVGNANELVAATTTWYPPGNGDDLPWSLPGSATDSQMSSCFLCKFDSFVAILIVNLICSSKPNFQYW